jgi:hypothetical protein
MAVPELVQHYLTLGATFVAVGTDVTSFATATDTLAAQYISRSGVNESKEDAKKKNNPALRSAGDVY